MFYYRPAVESSAMRGIISIIIGIIFIAGGLSGNLTLVGTHNGKGLAVAGGVMILIGIIRLARG
jgi:hypothetical protein